MLSDALQNFNEIVKPAPLPIQQRVSLRWWIVSRISGGDSSMTFV